MACGGAELRTLDLMEALDPALFKFEFCVLSGLPGELDSKILALGGKVHYLRLGISFHAQFATLLRSEKYHVVHSHVHLFSGYLLRTAYFAQVPVRICHLHTTEKSIGFRKKVQNRLMRNWLTTYANHFIAVSQGVLNAFFEFAPHLTHDSRCTLIYDAINLERFEAASANHEPPPDIPLFNEAKLIVHVGRFNPVKNHEKLFEVFRQIQVKLPCAKLLLLGEGDTARTSKLHELAKTLMISDSVIFLGNRTDVPEILARADLMIFPSKWEGLPGAVLEASALGLPVLCSVLPGSLEIKAYFSSIHCLSLLETNDAWAEVAHLLLQQTRTTSEKSLEILRHSPFTVRYCLQQMSKIWKSA